jgi:hypothetical protein
MNPKWWLGVLLLICAVNSARAEEPPPGKIKLKLEIERPADAPVLLDAPIRMIYQRPTRPTGKEPPAGEIAKLAEGDNTVDLSTFPDGKQFFYLRRDGCAAQWIYVTITNGEASCDRTDLMLYRTRYVIIHYAWNKKGERALVGDGIETGRVALTHWTSLDFFKQDWQIWQGDGLGGGLGAGPTFGAIPALKFHRMGSEFGFADAPAGSTFDDLREAPAPTFNKMRETYKTTSRDATPGLLLFCRVNGGRTAENALGYGKIEIEEISLTPPKDVKILSAK